MGGLLAISASHSLSVGPALDGREASDRGEDLAEAACLGHGTDDRRWVATRLRERHWQRRRLVPEDPSPLLDPARERRAILAKCASEEVEKGWGLGRKLVDPQPRPGEACGGRVPPCRDQLADLAPKTIQGGHRPDQAEGEGEVALGSSGEVPVEEPAEQGAAPGAR